jgi:hypothetical protein
MGEMGNANNDGMRLLGRPKRRWEDNIRMNFREIEWECVNWVHPA